MKKEDIIEEVKGTFWGAVGECDCSNESARAGMDAVSELLEYIIDEKTNFERILADAADANAKSAAYERIEHAKTANILRRILEESASYLQAKTKDEAMERVKITGNCVCLPNREDHDAAEGGSDAPACSAI